MPLPAEFSMQVNHLSDASEARRQVRNLAAQIGFQPKDTEELAIVVSELVSNLVKHAAGGELLLNTINADGRQGIIMITRDNGPGIADFDMTITDGYSTSGSLGYGLGTVHRLMDELDYTNRCDGQSGAIITCKRWKRESIQQSTACPLSVGVSTRACPGIEVNGDEFVVKKWDNSVLIALIDGLGHGHHAAVAAKTARAYIEQHYNKSVETLFHETNRACRGTRGVVMAVALFTWSNESVRLSYANVGNIEARILGASRAISLMGQRGVVGFNAADPVANEYDWDLNSILVLCSDGVDASRIGKVFPEIKQASASHMAQQLLYELARNDDDATVIVVAKAITGGGESDRRCRF